jgi:rifampicin phosphotransferase
MLENQFVCLLDGSTYALDRIGGKAASLTRLRALNAPVPRAFAVTTDAYRRHVARIGIPNLASAVPVSELPAVRAAIFEAMLAPEIGAAIAEAVEATFADEFTPLAVRSSATTEDSPAFSFAGLHDTLLAVTGDPGELELAVKSCWASLWSERSVDYRRRGDAALDGAAMAVVIQQMVRADVSFVAFSVDPVDQCARRVIISASYGLGEAIVAGLVVPDYIVLEPGGEVMDYQIGSKEMMIISDSNGDGGVRQVPVPRLVANQRALSDDQVRHIGQLVTDLEQKFGSPIDVEGGIAGGTLSLFQARPITTCCFPN